MTSYPAGTPMPPPRPIGPPPVQSAAPGVLAWGLGLLVLFPLPFVGTLMACTGMTIAGMTGRKNPGAVGRISGRAVNWGLTYLLASFVLVGAHFTILFVAQEIDDFLPFGYIILTWVALSIVHVVLCLIAMTRASKYRELRVWAIPFVRARQP